MAGVVVIAVLAARGSAACRTPLLSLLPAAREQGKLTPGRVLELEPSRLGVVARCRVADGAVVARPGCYIGGYTRAGSPGHTHRGCGQGLLDVGGIGVEADAGLVGAGIVRLGITGATIGGGWVADVTESTGATSAGARGAALLPPAAEAGDEDEGDDGQEGRADHGTDDGEGGLRYGYGCALGLEDSGVGFGLIKRELVRRFI